MTRRRAPDPDPQVGSRLPSTAQPSYQNQIPSGAQTYIQTCMSVPRRPSWRPDIKPRIRSGIEGPDLHTYFRPHFITQRSSPCPRPQPGDQKALQCPDLPLGPELPSQDSDLYQRFRPTSRSSCSEVHSASQTSNPISSPLSESRPPQ